MLGAAAVPEPDGFAGRVLSAEDGAQIADSGRGRSGGKGLFFGGAGGDSAGCGAAVWVDFTASESRAVDAMDDIVLCFQSSDFLFCGTAGIAEGVVFYIWIGIFNVFSVVQLWSFASDLFNEEQIMIMKSAARTRPRLNWLMRSRVGCDGRCRRGGIGLLFRRKIR